MSIPAGWYDDGSGRQRWWDGARWTDNYAPVQGAGVGSAQPGVEAHEGVPGAYASPGPATSAQAGSTPDGPGRQPVLGFVGLGLAVLGIILACIPVVFGFGVVVLLAAFVVSLIGLFAKGTAKWPSIVGMVLSVIGGVVGAIVFVVSLLMNAPGPIILTPETSTAPSASSAPSAPAESSDPPVGSSGSRPTPQEIADAAEAAINQSNGLRTYDDMPEFYPCVGQYVYDSDLSDESLELLVAGYDPLASELDLATQVISDAVLTCDPQPGATPQG